MNYQELNKNNSEPQSNLLSLSPALQLLIYSNLKYNDLLSIRSTCKPLQQLIRDWNYFQEITQFTLGAKGGWGNPDGNTSSILDPNSLILNNLCLSRVYNRIFNNNSAENPILHYTHLTHIGLREVEFSWLNFQQFIKNFPNINSLQFIYCTLIHGQHEGWAASSLNIKKWENLCQKIEFLELEVSYADELEFWFTVFRNVPKLRTLTIHAGNPIKKRFRDGDEFDILQEYFTKLLLSASESLQEISIKGNNTSAFEPFYHYFLKPCLWDLEDYKNATNQNLIELKQLETLSLLPAYINPKDFENSLVDPVQLKNSLLETIFKTSTQLTGLCLPIDLEISDSKYFIQCLPKSVERLYANIDWKKVESLKFLNKFPQLDELGINFNQNLDLINEKEYPNIKGLTLLYEKPPNFHHLPQIFVNLTTLYIQHSKLLSTHLQIIIANLSKLEVLLIQTIHQSNCKESKEHCIDDFGVAGIRTAQCNQLRKKTAVENELDLEEDMRTGLPLSHLKELTELTISCSRITDIGVYYGMKFGPKIQKITLGCNEITSHGIYLLASMNPSLSILTIPHVFSNKTTEIIQKIKQTNPAVHDLQLVTDGSICKTPRLSHCCSSFDLN